MATGAATQQLAHGQLVQQGVVDGRVLQGLGGGMPDAAPVTQDGGGDDACVGRAVADSVPEKDIQERDVAQDKAPHGGRNNSGALRRARSLEPDFVALFLVPATTIAAGAFALGMWLPASPVEVRINLDLRAAVLLLGALAAVATGLCRAPALKSSAALPAVAVTEAQVKVTAHVKTNDMQVQADLPEPEVCGLPQDILEQLMQWRMSLADAEERRKQANEVELVNQLYQDMAGTSPALIHRFPKQSLDKNDSYWSSPMFTACGYLWSIRMGPLHGNSTGARYFCLLPHGHSERLRCSFLFARRAGDGYKERRVNDWPIELAGHPWGPTIPDDEIQSYVQADGTILLMIHAVGLGAESDPEGVVSALPPHLIKTQDKLQGSLARDGA